MKRGIAASMAILVASVFTVLAGLTVADFGWVYDDHRFIEGNHHLDVVAAAPWTSWDPGVTSADGAEPGMWRPLRTLSFTIDRALFAAAPAGPHLHSLLLHAVAAGLVTAIALALGVAAPGASVAGLLFGLHPVQVEAFAWVSSRGDLLCGALLLAAVLLHLRERSRWAVALAGLAFLAKESAVVAPLLFAVADLAAGGTDRVRRRHLVHASSAAILLGLVVMRWAVLSGSSATFGQGAGLGFGPAALLEAQPALFGHYFVRVAVPVPGMFDAQLVPSLGLGLIAVTGLAALAMLRSAGRLRPVAPALAMGALWAVVALLPVTLMQVLFPLKILVADRFLHLAMAGPAVALAAALGHLGTLHARAPLVLGVAVVVSLLPGQRAALEPWRSDETLWSEVLRRDPGHARALYAMAESRAVAEPIRAKHSYLAYLDQVPGDPGAWYRLGLLEERLALAGSGDSEGAVARKSGLIAAAGSLHRSIALWAGGETEGRVRGLVAARLARATVLATLGDKEAAAVEAQEASALWPDTPERVRSGLTGRWQTLRSWATSIERRDVLRAMDDADAAVLAAREEAPR